MLVFFLLGTVFRSGWNVVVWSIAARNGDVDDDGEGALDAVASDVELWKFGTF